MMVKVREGSGPEVQEGTTERPLSTQSGGRVLAIGVRASSGDSTGVLPAFTACEGPRASRPGSPALLGRSPANRTGGDCRELRLDGQGYVLLLLNFDLHRDVKRLDSRG